MTYSITRLIDPYRGIFEIVDTADDYETAWRRAGVARQEVPEQIFFVMSAETREDPNPARAKVIHIRGIGGAG
jgi:hypothetical protein